MLQYVLYLDLYLAPTFGDSSTSQMENIKNKDTTSQQKFLLQKNYA